MTNPPYNPHQDKRDGKGRYQRTLENAQRDAQAAELYSQGHTYQEIATQLEITKWAAIRAVQRAVRAVVQGPGEEVLKLHIDRLEYLYSAALDILETDHVVVSHGKVITMPDPETGEEKPLIDSGPKLAAIREARASLESFRRLTGLDQPSKVNLSGGVKYEVVGIDPEDLT